MNSYTDHKKSAFGTTIVNKCKTKELNMFIEKASRMMTLWNSQKEHSVGAKSDTRTHSQSIDVKKYEPMDVSSIVPSTRISLLKDNECFSSTMNLKTHFRNQTSDLQGGLKPGCFKSMTQKNSFVEKQEALAITPVKGHYNRGSLQASATRNQSLEKTLQEAHTYSVNSPIKNDNPFEVTSRNTSSDKKVWKCTQNMKFQYSPRYVYFDLS